MNDKELVETGKQVVRSRGRPKGSGGNSRADLIPQTDPGEISEILSHAMRGWDLTPVDMSNYDEVAQRVRLYFERCIEDDSRPSVVGLASFLGIDRTNLWRYRVGELGKSEEVRNLLKKTAVVLEEFDIECMKRGKINPVSAIFILKNHYGYQDKQEVVVTPNNPLGDETDAKKLTDKYTDTVTI